MPAEFLTIGILLAPAGAAITVTVELTWKGGVFPSN